MIRRIVHTTWFVMCLIGGTTLGCMLLKSKYDIHFPIFMFLWLAYLFGGHAFIRRFIK